MISAVEHNALIHLAEEAGELVQATTKLLRFGRVATDPKTGIEYDNVADLVREFNDVQKRFQEFMNGEYIPYHQEAESGVHPNTEFFIDGASAYRESNS